jgi:hypothetical protein
MWKNVESITKIKIDQSQFDLVNSLKANKVKESDQVGKSKFTFDRTMLGRVQFRFKKGETWSCTIS